MQTFVCSVQLVIRRCHCLSIYYCISIIASSASPSCNARNAIKQSRSIVISKPIAKSIFTAWPHHSMKSSRHTGRSDLPNTPGPNRRRVHICRHRRIPLIKHNIRLPIRHRFITRPSRLPRLKILMRGIVEASPGRTSKIPHQRSVMAALDRGAMMSHDRVRAVRVWWVDSGIAREICGTVLIRDDVGFLVRRAR